MRSSSNAAVVVPQASIPSHPNNLNLQSVVSSGVGTGGEVGYNDDHESREFTEAEENVMRPINMLQERQNTNSARDQQQSLSIKQGKDVLLLIAEHDK